MTGVSPRLPGALITLVALVVEGCVAPSEPGPIAPDVQQERGDRAVGEISRTVRSISA
ncbi:hypothetical protein RBH85_03235 [Streptomyces rochei]|nr:hypothetical protein [Streptomyces rochei]WMI55915.1 hypothetical protein RBH85_03235 [Streptomyces rochei]